MISALLRHVHQIGALLDVDARHIQDQMPTAPLKYCHVQLIWR